MVDQSYCFLALEDPHVLLSPFSQGLDISPDPSLVVCNPGDLNEQGFCMLG